MMTHMRLFRPQKPEPETALQPSASGQGARSGPRTGVQPHPRDAGRRAQTGGVPAGRGQVRTALYSTSILGLYTYRFSCRRIPPIRDWARETLPDAPGNCFGRGGSPKRKHRTGPRAVSANGCLVARTPLVSPMESRKKTIYQYARAGRIPEPARRAAAVPCPNVGGHGTGRASDELYAMLPILGAPGPKAALAVGRTNPTLRRLPHAPRRPAARPLDNYLSWMSPVIYPNGISFPLTLTAGTTLRVSSSPDIFC